MVHLHMDVVDDIQSMLQVVTFLCCLPSPLTGSRGLHQREVVWHTTDKAAILQRQENLLDDCCMSCLLHVLEAAQTCTTKSKLLSTCQSICEQKLFSSKL